MVIGLTPIPRQPCPRYRRTLQAKLLWAVYGKLERSQVFDQYSKRHIATPRPFLRYPPRFALHHSNLNVYF